MPWNSRGRKRLALCLILFLVSLLLPAESDKQLAVYTPKTSYTIDVHDLQGELYFSPADLLNPLGATALQQKGKDWKLQLHDIEAVFTEGKDKALIGGKSLDLGGKVLVENGKLLAPLNSSALLVGALLHKTAELRPSARRLFVDSAATHFTAELKKSDKTTLALNFSQPVYPTVSQEDGRIRLTFRHEPLVSDMTNQPFDDSAIQAISFSEDNGKAILTITGGPRLSVTASADGKSMVVSLPSSPVADQTPPPSSPPAETASAQPAQGRVPAGFVVMIDPGHGGDDPGGMLGGRIAEKDVTLSLARRLKGELQDRGIAARLLRDSDSSLSLEERAQVANQQRGGIYLSLHAGPPGPGIRIYTAALGTNAGAATGPFLPWETAQRAYLKRSQSLAQSILAELSRKEMSVTSLRTALRPLNSIAAPAVAVELGPDPDNPQEIGGQKYQTAVAAGLAAAISQVRSQVEGQP